MRKLITNSVSSSINLFHKLSTTKLKTANFPAQYYFIVNSMEACIGGGIEWACKLKTFCSVFSNDSDTHSYYPWNTADKVTWRQEIKAAVEELK